MPSPALPDGTRLLLLAPLVRARKGEYKNIFEDMRRAGYVRVRVDGEVRDLGEDIELDKYKQHTIEVVVDRLVIHHAGEARKRQWRRRPELTQSCARSPRDA